MKYFLIISLFLLPIWLEGQDEPSFSNQFSWSIGTRSIYFKDLHYSPLNHKGIGAALHFKYTKNFQSNALFQAILGGSYAVLKTNRSELMNADYTMATLQLSYLKALQQKNDWQFWLGGQYRFNLGLLYPKEFNGATFVATHSLDVATRINYQLEERHRIIGQLSIPIINLLVRPPYNNFDEELERSSTLQILTNGTWTSLNANLAIQWELDYLYELSGRSHLLLRYSSYYQKVDRPNELKQFQTNWQIGLSHHF